MKKPWAVLIFDRALTRSDARYHEYAKAGETVCGRPFTFTEVYNRALAHWVLRGNAEKFAQPCKQCLSVAGRHGDTLG